MVHLSVSVFSTTEVRSCLMHKAGKNLILRKTAKKDVCCIWTAWEAFLLGILWALATLRKLQRKMWIEPGLAREALLLGVLRTPPEKLQRKM